MTQTPHEIAAQIITDCGLRGNWIMLREAIASALSEAAKEHEPLIVAQLDNAVLRQQIQALERDYTWMKGERETALARAEQAEAALAEAQQPPETPRDDLRQRLEDTEAQLVAVRGESARRAEQLDAALAREHQR